MREKQFPLMFRAMPAMVASMIVWIFLGLAFSANAQSAKPLSSEVYLEKWKDEAVYQMAIHKIPASITLAQGLLESGNGNSALAAKSNNHFGIKCHGDWTGKTVKHDDDKRGECFRAYPDAALSFEDHSVFLKRDGYIPLFDLEMTDYKGWARGLKKCGYATNSKYAYLLIDLIERYDLTQYDEEGLKLMAEREAFTTQSEQIEERQIALNPKKPMTMYGNRAMQISDNHIQYTLALVGDSYDDLAQVMDMMPWQLYRYNEIDRVEDSPYQPAAGEVIYLQPKRNRGTEYWLQLKEGETLWEASQRSGVSVKSLIRKNRLSPKNPIPSGGKISLKWKVTETGKLPGWVRTLFGPSG
jgi:hypothetical protein